MQAPAARPQQCLHPLSRGRELAQGPLQLAVQLPGLPRPQLQPSQQGADEFGAGRVAAQVAHALAAVPAPVQSKIRAQPAAAPPSKFAAHEALRAQRRDVDLGQAQPGQSCAHGNFSGFIR